VAILSSFIGKEIADLWAHILVGREYILYSKSEGYTPVRYEVGQPMGALSS